MNEIIEKLRFDHETGSLSFNGIRYMLVRPETIVEVQKVIEEKYGAEIAHDIFYRSGFRGTSLSAQNLLKTGMGPAQCLKEMFAMGASLGWGKFQTPGINQNKEEINVTITASPFAGAYGASDHPICAILCGALAGIFSTLYGKTYVCEEERCAASGDPTCHFILKPRASND